MRTRFFTPLLRNPATACRLENTRNGRVLADRLIPAFDSATRNQGLLGRDSMDEGEGIIIAPTNAVHTFFMRFAIDIAFVTKEGRIVKISRAVKPWRIAAALRGYAVVELPAGTLARCETVAGDTIAVLVAGEGTER